MVSDRACISRSAVLCLLVWLLTSLTASAQQLSVVQFREDVGNTAAVKYPVRDANGQLCALVKVRMATYQLRFAGDIVRTENREESEFWVYMVSGSSWLEIKCANTPALTYDFPASVRIEGGHTYIMQLERHEASATPPNGATASRGPRGLSILTDSRFDSYKFWLFNASMPISSEALKKEGVINPFAFGNTFGGGKRLGWHASLMVGMAEVDSIPQYYSDGTTVKGYDSEFHINLHLSVGPTFRIVEPLMVGVATGYCNSPSPYLPNGLVVQASLWYRTDSGFLLSVAYENVAGNGGGSLILGIGGSW